MGITAENVAAKCGITREQQDAFAVESHKRAAAAIAAGHFKSQILPIELKSKKGPTVFDTDEHVRGESTLEGMAKLRAVFVKENGTRDGGQRVRHQRRRGRGRADGEVARPRRRA